MSADNLSGSLKVTRARVGVPVACPGKCAREAFQFAPGDPCSVDKPEILDVLVCEMPELIPTEFERRVNPVTLPDPDFNTDCYCVDVATDVKTQGSDYKLEWGVRDDSPDCCEGRYSLVLTVPDFECPIDDSDIKVTGGACGGIKVEDCGLSGYIHVPVIHIEGDCSIEISEEKDDSGDCSDRTFRFHVPHPTIDYHAENMCLSIDPAMDGDCVVGYSIDARVPKIDIIGQDDCGIHVTKRERPGSVDCADVVYELKVDIPKIKFESNSDCITITSVDEDSCGNATYAIDFHAPDINFSVEEEEKEAEKSTCTDEDGNEYTCTCTAHYMYYQVFMERDCDSEFCNWYERYTTEPSGVDFPCEDPPPERREGEVTGPDARGHYYKTVEVWQSNGRKYICGDPGAGDCSCPDGNGGWEDCPCGTSPEYGEGDDECVVCVRHGVSGDCTETKPVKCDCGEPEDPSTGCSFFKLDAEVTKGDCGDTDIKLVPDVRIVVPVVKIVNKGCVIQIEGNGGSNDDPDKNVTKKNPDGCPIEYTYTISARIPDINISVGCGSNDESTNGKGECCALLEVVKTGGPSGPDDDCPQDFDFQIIPHIPQVVIDTNTPETVCINKKDKEEEQSDESGCPTTMTFTIDVPETVIDAAGMACVVKNDDEAGDGGEGESGCPGSKTWTIVVPEVKIEEAGMAYVCELPESEESHTDPLNSAGDTCQTTKTFGINVPVIDLVPLEDECNLIDSITGPEPIGEAETPEGVKCGPEKLRFKFHASPPPASGEVPGDPCISSDVKLELVGCEYVLSGGLSFDKACLGGCETEYRLSKTAGGVCACECCSTVQFQRRVCITDTLHGPWENFGAPIYECDSCSNDESNDSNDSNDSCDEEWEWRDEGALCEGCGDREGPGCHDSSGNECECGCIRYYLWVKPCGCVNNLGEPEECEWTRAWTGPDDPSPVFLDVCDVCPPCEEEERYVTEPASLADCPCGGVITKRQIKRCGCRDGSNEIVECDWEDDSAYEAEPVCNTCGPTGNPGKDGPTGSAGDKGKDGPTGSAGDRGKDGPTGCPGKDGPTGSAGDKGKDGPTGSVGDGGKDGPTGSAGDKGKDGPTGFAGENGKDGPTGAAGGGGKDGPTGCAGECGMNGPTGCSGENGKDGPTGSAGENGKDGPTGAAGDRGNDGPTGCSGECGMNGPTGCSGECGVNGPTGAAGDKGKDGPTGSAGLPGKRGPTGVQGNPGHGGGRGNDGPTGPAGGSGDKGPTGPMGGQGDQGPTGPAGEQGEKGPTGPVGPVGPTGQPGPDGPTGERGQTGPNGQQGPTGSKGQDGAGGGNGPTGAKGVTGDKGPTGTAGPSGPKGETGDIGPTGTSGTPGTAGPAGDAGPTGSLGPTGTAGPTGLTDLPWPYLEGPTSVRVVTADLTFEVDDFGRGLFVVVPYMDLYVSHGLIVDILGPTVDRRRLQ